MRTPTQRDLDFAEADRARQLRERAEADADACTEIVRGPVARLGHKHFAVSLGLGVEKVDRIYHWIERRNGQRVPVELLLAVCREDDGAMAAFCELAGYEAPKRRIDLPDAEVARRAIAALREFGAAGEQKITALLGRPLLREKQEWER